MSLFHDTLDTSLGILTLEASERGLRSVRFPNRPQPIKGRMTSNSVIKLAKRELIYLHIVEMGDDRGDGGFPASRDPLFAELREIWSNTLITKGGYNRQMADSVIDAGLADMVAFGTPYLANPDLAERLLNGAAYNKPDRATFYGGSATGYTDYPFLGQ